MASLLLERDDDDDDPTATDVLKSNVPLPPLPARVDVSSLNTLTNPTKHPNKTSVATTS